MNSYRNKTKDVKNFREKDYVNKKRTNISFYNFSTKRIFQNKVNSSIQP